MKPHKHIYKNETTISPTHKITTLTCTVEGCKGFSILTQPLSLAEKKKYHPEMFEAKPTEAKT